MNRDFARVLFNMEHNLIYDLKFIHFGPNVLIYTGLIIVTIFAWNF